MMGKTTLLRRLLTILVVLAGPVAWTGGAGVAWAQSGVDRVLLDMRDAHSRNHTSALTAALPRLRGHALEPLAAYWELSARLDQASESEITAFLRRYAGTYYEDRLRNDWLLLLGQRGDWDTFSREVPLFRMNDDREVQCYSLLIEHERQGRDVAEAVRERWLAQRDADDGCAMAAQALIKAGRLPAEAAWQRARWAMENNRPRAGTQAVGLLDPDWVAIVNALHANPARYLDEKVTAVRPRTKELVTLALIRLAASNPDAAAVHADRLRWKTQLTNEERSWIWGVIGKRKAQRLDADALVAYGHADVRHLHDEHLAWMARAALRAGAWPRVLTAIGAMGPSQREDPVWMYWQARALQAQGSPAALSRAQGLLHGIAGTAGFYEQLALEAVGQSVTPPRPPEPLTTAEREAARRHPGLQRALQAIALGLRREGVREWHYSIALHTPGGMSERELLAAADLACAHEVWDRCINTSKRTTAEIDHAQRFPMPFRDAVVSRATAIGLEPAYVYGLIRQESRFIMNARSHVGASGLMQVMPTTATWTARRIGLTGFKPQQITDHDTNITIGTAYLKLALDDFEGSMPMATAAYNAGPNRPRAWRNGPVLEAAIWIENIPFNETRDYVKRVLANTNNYAALLTGLPQKPSSRLGVVGPTARVPDTDLP